jgi:HK97 family phage major capsid protein
LPVIESEAVAPKTAWCAAWNYGVVYDREQATVTATDSHADFFVRNLVAILAEMRAAFAIMRPSAFVKITLP